MDITLNDIIDHLGQPRTKISTELIWQCPICMDKSADNLHYNPNKNILWCFANDEHSKIILSEIMKKKHEEKKMSNVEVPKYVRCQERYIYYQLLSNDILLGKFDKNLLDEMYKMDMFDKKEYETHLQVAQTDKPQKALEYLYKSRGIGKQAVEDCGIGIDFYEQRWVIPIYDISATLVGFEYRGLDFKNKQIKKEIGTPTCLCAIYGATNSKKVVIVEGLLDGVVLSQLAKDSLIVSCSNGVQGTLKCLSQLQFNKYDEIKLILDNDNAGSAETEKIINQYPFIKDCRQFLIDSGVKDIGDWYMAKYMNNML